MELKALSRLGWSVTALAREYGSEPYDGLQGAGELRPAEL